MSDVEPLLAQCRALGAELIPGPSGALKVQAPAPLSAVLLHQLRHHKREIIDVLTKPHLTARGELIIPFFCAPRYRWWADGQGLYATLRELGAPPEVMAKYVDPTPYPLQGGPNAKMS